MRLDGIHHISAITGDARRNVDFYTRVLGPPDDRQDGQPGRSERLPPLLRRRARPPRRRPDVLRVPRRQARPRRRRHGAPRRLARRRARGARLLGRAPGRRGRSTARATATRCVFADPEGLGHELVVVATRRPAAASPSTPRSRPSTRSRASRASARTARTPTARRALLEQLMGATRPRTTTFELRGERRGGWIALRPARRRSAAARAPASSTTSPGARRDDELPAWIDDARPRRRSRTAATSTATTSTRSTSASPAGSSTSSPPRSPASPSTARRRSSARALILPPFLEHRRAEIEARLTPLPDPRALSGTTSG